MPERITKSKKLFYPDCPNKYDFVGGKLITKKRFKNALSKTSKALKKFSDLKNNLGKKLIHKAATNDTVSNFIESIPVVGDALNTTIKVSDKAIRKAEDIYLSIFRLEKTYTKEQIIEFYVNNHFDSKVRDFEYI